MTLTCKKRNKAGHLCGNEGAKYGVTIRMPGQSDQFYTIMCCKNCWFSYLQSPREFIAEHEVGSLAWLMKNVEGVEILGSSGDANPGS